MDAKVSCTACRSYRPEVLQPAVRQCLEALGGIGRFVKPGDRVLCKVNLLVPAPAERAITTHPEVVRAVVREIRDAGGIPLVGDNPAALGQKAVLLRSGIASVLREEGVEVADMGPTVRIENPRARAYHAFDVSRAALEADLLLNLPKLKTHALTYMTLAVKNLFGVIPGMEKARWHFRAPTAEDFAVLLVDLYGALLHHRAGRPLLHLLDGVLGMEGDGPATGGKPRMTGLLLASEDGVALDRVACRLVQLDADRLLTCRLAAAQGLGTAELMSIELTGHTLAELQVEDFVAPRGMAAFRTTWPLNTRFLRNRLVERPVVSPELCTSCGQCARICPTQAIHVAGPDSGAVIDVDRCIRCYCCAEVCPEAAVKKCDPPLLGRLLASQRALLLAGLGVGLGLLGIGGALAWLLLG